MEENNNNNQINNMEGLGNVNQNANMNANMNPNMNQNMNQNPNNKKGKSKVIWIVLGVILAIVLGLQIYAMASGHSNIIRMVQDWTSAKSVSENKIEVKIDNDTKDKIKEGVDKIKESVQELIKEGNKEAKDKAEEVGENIKEKSEKVGENVKEKSEEIEETVKEKVGEIKEKVEEGIEKVGEKIDEAKAIAEVRRLFLNKLKNDNEKNTEKLVDYRVDEVKLLSDEEKKGLINMGYLSTDTLAYVTYSVKPKDINNTGWMAGNGEVSGNWVANKTACVCVRDGEINFSGTSW